MELIYSDFFERLNKGEAMWITLPATIIKQLPVGIVCDAMTAGGLAKLDEETLKKHNNVFNRDEG